MTGDDFKPWLRIGYISPHPLVDTLAYEFYLMAPPRTMMVAACIEIEDYTLEAIEKQLPILDSRIDSLLKRGAGRVVLSGVPIALALGRTRIRSLLERIADRWSVPADTDLEAIIAGTLALGARRVGVATRWKAAMNERLAAYLSEAGIEVVETASSARSMAENAELDDAAGIALAVELGTRALSSPSQPEALIMPGGRWLTLGPVRDLEERFGRPVVTNFAAGLWTALRDARQAEPIRGWGRLLATPARSP